MQSVQSLEAQLAEARNALVDDQRRLGELRAAKALDSMSDDDTAELRTVRARIREREDEVGDLEVALKVGREFAASAAGEKLRADAVATVQRVESVGIALHHAAALEDAAGAAYEKAMEQRASLQAAMQTQARQVVELLRGPVNDQRLADQVSHLMAAADGGIPQAAAWRISRLARGTRGMISLAPGVHFDAQARLTVASAARSSLSGLLLRLAGVLQAAGVPVPEQGQDAARRHAERIVAALDDSTTSEAG